MKKIFALALLFCIFAFQAEAEVMNLADATSGDAIREVTAHITIKSESETFELILFSRDGTLELNIPNVPYSGTIILDDASTDAPDYYFSGNLVIDKDTTIEFIPIAQVRGNVFDSLQNLVDGAQLEFRCDKLSTLTFPEKTDKYGSFEAYIPTGKCLIAGAHGNYVGHESIEALRGSSAVISIALDGKKYSNSVLFPVITVLIIVILLVHHKKRSSRSKKKGFVVPSIIKTLNETEQRIVMHLLENKNKVSSSQMRHVLKIPKTSMARILANLERKKIIRLERLGKSKQVYIAEWLLKK